MNRIVLALLVACVAAPALAKAPSSLVRCDGYGRRVGVGENLARLPLVIGTLGLFGAPEADNPLARETGEKGVFACTEALTDARVTGNPIRRGEVLLMRGVRNFETGNLDAAAADAEAAAAITLPAEVTPWYDRTVKLSALLLAAHVRLAQNRDDEAETLAAQAVAARPWSPFVLNEALRIMAVSPAIGNAEAPLLDRAMLLSVSTLRAQARERAGDWAGAASDLAALIKSIEKPDVVQLARLAVLQALAGDRASAEATLATAQQQVDELAATAGGTDSKAQDAAQRVARADELMQLARAQLALAAGKTEDARALLLGRSRWLAPAPIAATVIANVQARLPAGAIPSDPAKLRGDAAKVARDAITTKSVVPAMAIGWPRWEDPDTAAALGRDLTTRPPPGGAARPGSVVKIERVREDGATLVRMSRLAFIDTGYEAALLLAARTAREAGAERFAVIERGSGFRVGREGLTSGIAQLVVVTPRDRLWAGQEGRSLAVADVEAALAPLFPAPVPPR